ncbi:hypothetical protein [Serratia sp. 14-2641]|uniref:hypothetical protein n=1 Tax=Serratia sp. 14-2641 TaxID=1841657 RepID=UPI00080FF9A1|nr:hypothetical protein [Serratia sp. 14-2641]OCJ27755.1 hypothetical protein A6U95_28460 [Serratia sp. 14-2641]
MNILFYAAANVVIAKFNKRMEHTQPERATAEMLTAVDLLEQLACVARYAGDESAAYIQVAAGDWRRTGKTPSSFGDL